MTAYPDDHPLRRTLVELNDYIQTMVIEVGEDPEATFDVADLIARTLGYLNQVAVGVSDVLERLDAQR